MKTTFVRDLTPNAETSGVFLVCQKEVRQKRSGEPYLSLVLGDKTGEMDAKMWDNVAAVAELFDREDFVRIKGSVQIFQNRPQLTIHRLQPVAAKDVDMADFLPSSPRPIEEMWQELHGLVAAIANPHLRHLLAAFFADEEIARLYRTAPAAKTVHHAYIGGLIEHVLSMAKMAKAASAHYPGIDADLLMTGVLLHDIGKIRELTFDRTFGYSTEGQLLGHIQIALRMIAEKIRVVPNFPPKLRLLLEHLILSHHGSLEFGSARVPVFPEAMLLHQLDVMDAKMNSIALATARDRNVEGEWTSYVPALERSLLKKGVFLGEAPPSAGPSSPPAGPPPEGEACHDTGPEPPASAQAPAVEAADNGKSAAEPSTAFGAQLLKALGS